MSEWYAYGGIEPFGGMQDDFRAGQICATVANYAGMQRAENTGPAQAFDFMPALNRDAGTRATTVGAGHARDEGLLLGDPEAQSSLIKAALFKKED